MAKKLIKELAVPKQQNTNTLKSAVDNLAQQLAKPLPEQSIDRAAPEFALSAAFEENEASIIRELYDRHFNPLKEPSVEVEERSSV